MTKSKSAVDKYSEGEIEEQIKLAYTEWQTAKLTGTTENANNFIKNRLDKIYNNIEEVEVDNEKIDVTIEKDGQTYSYKYDIKLGTVNKSYKDYVGYYADIDGDGTVDGIIFADLLVGNTKGKQWMNSKGTYNIPVIDKVELKSYYISQKEHEGIFGIKDVLSLQESTSGENRFYIMSLTNFTTLDYTSFFYYKNAYGTMSDYSSTTNIGFGKGIDNTKNMIQKWENNEYGEQDDRDIWKHIKTKYNKGWFLPSKEELAAFAEELGIRQDNYSQFGIGGRLLSSSQIGAYSVYSATFESGTIDDRQVKQAVNVRLATTF